MRPRFTKSISLLVAALVLGGTGEFARADAPSLDGGTAVLKKSREAPRFYGFTLDWSIYDSSGLNTTNYTNTIDNYFFPAWGIGRLFLRDTRFQSLTLSARFVVTQPLAGFDEAFFTGQSDTGRITPCANLTPVNGQVTINNSTVPRCPYDAQRRTDYSDLRLTLSNRGIYTVPKAEISINPAFSLSIPTSLQSRLSTMQAAIAPSLGVSRSFLGGKIGLSYGFSFTKYFYADERKVYGSSPGQLGNTSPGDATLTQSQGGISATDVQGNWANFLADPTRATTTGRNNTNYTLGHIFTLDLNPIDKLSFTFIYWLTNSRDIEVGCSGSVTVNGQSYDPCTTGATIAARSGSQTLQTAWRDAQIFWASANYQVLDWMAISASWITASSLRKEDGSLRQPFISTNYDAFTTVSLGFTFTLDKAAARLVKAH